MRETARSWATFLLLGLLLTACGGQNATESLPDPKALLDKAALDIQSVETVRFKLQLTGAPAFVDTANIISFVSATGSYQAPDKVEGKVSAKVAGIPGQIDIVAVGDDQYYKHIVLTGNHWIEEAFSPGFNADKLIRSEEGLRHALESLGDVRLVGREDLFGTPVYRITGTASVADISAVTVGLIRGTGEATAEIFIRVEDGLVERIVLVQPETATEQEPDPTTWTFELYDYNDPTITIDVPVFVPAGTPGLSPGSIPQRPGPAPTAEVTTTP